MRVSIGCGVCKHYELCKKACRTTDTLQRDDYYVCFEPGLTPADYVEADNA